VRYITVTANTFDEAVQIAKSQYGSLLRIHSRRDVIGKKKFLFGKKKSYVELTCYIADKKVEEEPIVEIIEEEVTVALETELLSEKELILEKGSAILEANGFSTTFNDAILKLMEEEEHLEQLTNEEFELRLVDRIVSLLEIDYEGQLELAEVVIFVGLSGSGKSSAIEKIATFGRHNIEIISFAKAKSALKTTYLEKEEQLTSFLHKKEGTSILIDTTNETDLEKVIHLISLFELKKKVVLVASATTKKEDLEKFIEDYNLQIDSVIITKFDESRSSGEAFSFCYEKELPLLFFATGSANSLERAAAATIISKIKALSLDFSTLWANQGFGLS